MKPILFVLFMVSLCWSAYAEDWYTFRILCALGALELVYEISRRSGQE